VGAFGDILRSRRQEMGYTLEQIEEETKIRRYYLKALEEERFEVLPGRVYAIGFVRRYARFLELNEEEVVEWFKAIVDESEPPAEAEIVEDKEQRFPVKIPLKNIIIGLLFLFLAVWAGKALVGFMTAHVEEDRNAPQVTDNAQPPSEPRASVTPKAPVEPQTPDDPSVPEPETQKPVEPAQPEKPPAVQPPSTPEPEVPTSTEPVTVRLRATERAWVTINVDGEHAYSGIMEPNEETEVRGGKVKVKSGNAGGIALVVDGKNIGPMGESGQVVEKTFGADS
jgi:cytoskeleton protein RodZ